MNEGWGLGCMRGGGAVDEGWRWRVYEGWGWGCMRGGVRGV